MHPFLRSFILPASVLLAGALLLSGCQNDEDEVASLMETGKTQAEAGQHKEAEIAFRKALQIDPNLAEAHFALANSFAADGKTRDALWEYAETVRLDPDNGQARLKLGALALLAGDHREALEQGLAAAELLPEEASAQLLIGQAHQALGDMEDAESAFLHATSISPDKATTLFVLGSFYMQQGDRERAEPIFVKMTEVEPNYFTFTTFARYLAGDEGRDESAEAAFERAIEVAKDEEIVPAYENLGSFLVTRERVEDARKVLERGRAALEPGSDGALRLTQLLADALEREDRADEAIALLEATVSQAPDSAQARVVLASLRKRTGDLLGAISAAEKAVELDPESNDAKLQLAEYLIEASTVSEGTDQIDEARAIVDEVLASEPSNPMALYSQGRIQLADQNVEGAIQSFRASIDARPDSPQAHYMLGKALVAAGNPRAGRAEVSRALELDPTMTVARRLIIQLHAALGEDEYAVGQARLYLQRNPDPQLRMLLAQSLARLGQTSDALVAIDRIPESKRTTEVVFARARLLMADGQVEAAREALLTAHAALPTHPKILRSLLQVDAQLGRLDESGARIEAAIAKDPNNAELQLLRGLYQMRSGDLEAAQKSFEHCLEIDDANLEAFSQLARLYQRTNRLDEAARIYEAAIAKQPEAAHLHHALGVIRQAQGDDAAAIASYEKAVELDEDMAVSKNNLAYLLAESGTDLQRALDLAQEAKAQRPNDPSASDTLGWVLYRRGVPAAAVGYLREAVAGLEPGTPEIGLTRHHLALAYEANEQKQLAIEALELSLAELEQRQSRQQAQGETPEKPDWAPAAREMLARLKG